MIRVSSGKTPLLVEPLVSSCNVCAHSLTVCGTLSRAIGRSLASMGPSERGIARPFAQQFASQLPAQIASSMMATVSLPTVGIVGHDAALRRTISAEDDDHRH